MYSKAIAVFFVVAALEDSGVISDGTPPNGTLSGKLILQWSFYPSGQGNYDPFMVPHGPMSFPHDIPREPSARPSSETDVPVVIRPTGEPVSGPTGTPAPLQVVAPSSGPQEVPEININPEEALNTMTVDPDENPGVVEKTYGVITEALSKIGVLKDILAKVLKSLKSRNACKGTPNNFHIHCCSETIEGHKFCFGSRREVLGFSTSVSYNDKPLFRRVSQGDMPFACVQFIPSISLLSFCVKIYGVERTEKRFHACYYFTIRVLKKDIVSFDFECIEINAAGSLNFLPSKAKKDVGYWNLISSKLNPFGDGPVNVVEQAEHIANFGKKVYDFIG